MIKVSLTKKDYGTILAEYGPIPYEKDGAFFEVEADEDLLDFIELKGMQYDIEEAGPNSVFKHANQKMEHYLLQSTKEKNDKPRIEHDSYKMFNKPKKAKRHRF